MYDDGQMPIYLRECAIVPDITMVREAITHEARFVVLDILLDGIEGLFLADLQFCVGPARNLDNHVEDLVSFFCVERNVVKSRDRGTITLYEKQRIR